MFSSLIQNKYLFLQMLKREIQGRYRGSQLGFIWAFVYPILMLLVYTFVFGMVMRVKWGVAGQDNIEFGIILFAGLLLHGMLAEVLIGAVGLITGNSQYVKKVVFPLPLLSFVSLANALFHMLLGLLLILILLLFHLQRLLSGRQRLGCQTQCVSEFLLQDIHLNRRVFSQGLTQNQIGS